MDRAELLALVEQLRLVGTDVQRIEVKSQVGKSLLETLSAFSNGGGGVVIVGLDERAGFALVEGFDASRAQDAFVSRCAQLTPVVRPELSIVPFGPGSLLVADIPELLPRDKPCYITERGRYQGSYLRTGDGDVRLQQYEVDRLVEEHTQPTWDGEPVPTAGVGDLDSEALSVFLAGQREVRPKTFADGDDVAMRRLGVLSGSSPTLASLLTLGLYPQEFFPRLAVTFAVFPGTTKAGIGAGVRLLDSATLTGPIPELVEAVIGAVRRNMRVGALIGDVYREELPDYPLVAVREAVVNALMHRDYSPMSRGTPVQVNLFVDRLEVVSPGGLYGAVTLRTLGNAGLSSTRNQRLATLLENVRLPGGGLVAENRGTGFAVMNAELTRALMPPVGVRDDLASFTVTFYRRKVASDERYRTAREAVVWMLGDRASVSTSELVRETDFSRSAIQQALNQLIGEGVIEATEPARSPRQRYRLTRG
ncbi:MAG: ATP-binding protein [Propioniciclava sp.]|uniref:ATP-binding protein n=1 Tax=Propioniciclava sp. TaxID=2038686 RepID=UPI0039E28D28